MDSSKEHLQKEDVPALTQWGMQPNVVDAMLSALKKDPNLTLIQLFEAVKNIQAIYKIDKPTFTQSVTQWLTRYKKEPDADGLAFLREGLEKQQLLFEDDGKGGKRPTRTMIVQITTSDLRVGLLEKYFPSS